jgi:hypothetical protein
MAQSGLLFEIVHMDEETTRWQLVTSANPGSALRLLEPFFVCWQGGICLRAGRAHPANATCPIRAQWNFWQRPGREIMRAIIDLSRKNRKILHYFCRIMYYLA